MAKKLKTILTKNEDPSKGGYSPKSGDERKFVAKHVVAKHDDANGNGDDVFNGSNVKAVDRYKEAHGYNPGQDEKVYEEYDLEEGFHEDRYSKGDKVIAHSSLTGPREGVVTHVTHDGQRVKVKHGTGAKSISFSYPPYRLKKQTNEEYELEEASKPHSYKIKQTSGGDFDIHYFDKDGKKLSQYHSVSGPTASKEVAKKYAEKHISQTNEEVELGKLPEAKEQDYQMVDGRARVYVNHKNVVTPKEVATAKSKLPTKAGKKWSFDTHGHDGERRYMDFTHVKEEVELDEGLFDKMPKSKAGWDYLDKKRERRNAEHEKQDPKMAKIYAQNIVDTKKAAKKARERGIDKKASDFGWEVRNSVQRGKLPEGVEYDAEQELTEYTHEGAVRAASIAKAKGKVKKAQLLMRLAKALEGGDNVTAKGIENELYNLKESSLLEKVLTKAELKKREEVAQAMEREHPGMGKSKKMAIATATAKRVAEDVDVSLLALYAELDEETRQLMVQLIDEGRQDELLEFANMLEEEDNGDNN